MGTSRHPTVERHSIPSVLVVGGSRLLVDATDKAANLPTVTAIKTCEIKGAATLAAQIRPYAIVVNDSLYGFDSAEFDALARDVGAAVVVVDVTGKTQKQLQTELLPQIAQAYKNFFR